jgi:hypothetical protein
VTTDDTHARYERFRITYPSGTAFDSHFLIGGGGTLRQVQVEHPMAVVEAIEDSLVSGETVP